MSNAELIADFRAMLDVNHYDYAYRRAVRAAFADRLADALEAADAKLDEAEDIALGLDYAHDHARVQALVLLFGDNDE